MGDMGQFFGKVWDEERVILDVEDGFLFVLRGMVLAQSLFTCL